VAIRTADFDRSLAFYTGVLGLEVKVSWGEAPERAVMVHAGDARYVEIFERGEAFEAGEGTILHFALRTDDSAGMLEVVRGAGMEITMETTDVDIQSPTGVVPVRIAFFKGPDGEVIELFQNETL
jgi:glyoxylase I family protein